MKWIVYSCSSSALLMAAALLLILTGCAVKPPPVVYNAPEDTVWVVQDESFDPLSLNEKDVIELPESKLKPYARDRMSGRTTPKSGSVKATEETAGFRVQIFATDLESEARTVEQEALIKFREGVYLVFDAPNYKIRVGDCLSRPEANDLRDKAVKLGYRDAWVVQSRVIPPER